ncbi:hypothetical protein CFC21_083186 [Triticum aestivum]|uniref:Uncharacterized protein n=4 Tax=Triticum TaxID=4564 RepID=A0A9R0SDJ1_TRITD|nr:uncharacterized protein LOC119286045 [Triticum dicoccoides]KAF7078822.1 hypothetical protein CFC21_083186 [Triticum aestivum]VAH92234.1 unnamed protein product [Triticum turgidum subsp. durum]
MIVARRKNSCKIRHNCTRHVLHKGGHFHYEAQNHTHLSLKKIHHSPSSQTMALVDDELKAKAEVYYDDEICKQCTRLLLKEAGLPNGLLPLKDIVECGYVEETGYVWLKQKKRIDHVFQSLGRVVSYGTEITAFAEKGRIRKVKGIKTRELMVWLPVEEISLDEPATGKLICKSIAGFSKIFPASAFHIPEKENEKANCAGPKPVVLMERAARVVKNN